MRQALRQLRTDYSLSATIAGCLAVLISFAGPLAIVFQAAKAANFSTEITSSWIWALSIGSGVTGAWLSWRLKTPIITAWSTPGAALLVVMLPSMPLPQAIGAYLVASLLIIAIGLSGVFDQLVARIPKGIAGAMLAGVLFHFGTEVFVTIESDPMLVLGLILLFLIARRYSPRYAMPLVMLVGIGSVLLLGPAIPLELNFVTPVFTAPQWSWAAIISLSLPLALVTLSGQYVPGMAVLRADGYQIPSKKVVTTTGLASFILAPFGGHAINLAAITAAICTSQTAHHDPSKRYIAGIACGLLYVLIGSFGSTLALLFAGLPHSLVAVLAGLALLGAISNGLAEMIKDEASREASIITLLVTASGMQFLGLGAAFWGLVLGGITFWISRAFVAK